MNETIGNIIARLRREKGWTQEQLANELGISYQAVSKWENELSSPDISALPLLAELFGVSIDALFGREAARTDEASADPPQPQEPIEAETYRELPWPDDDTLHVVLFAGHKLVGQDGGERLFSRKQVTFQYKGPALNIESAFSVTVEGDVEGSVRAGGDVQCGDVGGSVSAEGDVTCDEVSGDVTAGKDVNCDEVGENVNAGNDVSCGDVAGNVSAGGDVICGDVGGSADADGGKGFSFRVKL